MDVTEIQEILPHRYPFLLVDRVTDIVNNEMLVAYKNISISDSVFQGHFPGHPIYPGVLILEGMAQAGGILAFKSMDMTKEEAATKVVYFMSIDKAKFRAPVKPGDQLEYRLNVIKHKGAIWMLKGEAFVDGKMVSEAELKAMVVDK
ncbi:3-hydroxyacyl-[acyl-carrier-protein] dehydratase, FabZ form [hydrothermal vent metagenome]|uniref:3-hydroxyacyl-[acyl-carrier-protein] dehydratase n=1 Tax=hydrothermal vent metagenome TaxID=652676 RepID=A0A1W1D2X2_9ZZZZ